MKVNSHGYLVLVLVPLLYLSCGADPEPPLALIDDSPVTISDLRHTPGYADYLDGFREKHDGRTPGLSEMKADPDFRDMLQQYVDDRSYLKVAAVKALQLQPTAVRAAMESSISQRFGSLKARQQWLSDKSHSAADFGNHVERFPGRQRWIDLWSLYEGADRRERGLLAGVDVHPVNQGFTR